MTNVVGLFGLGLIGMALTGRLQQAGATVVGHDPDPARRAGFETLGGRVKLPAEIWAEAQTVILAVFDTDQVEAVIAAAPAECEACVIITSTCDPDRVAALPERGPRGLQLVEAPISGTSAEVAAGTAMFLLGGQEAAVARAVALLDQLERASHHVGPLGHASRAKLAINLILGLNRAALAEGLVFAELLGLEPEALLQVARDSAAASAVMATKGPLMVSGDHRPQGRIVQSAKDFGLIVQSADAKGKTLPFATTYLSLMQDCIAAGEASLDNSAIIRAIRRAGPASAASGQPEAPQTSRHHQNVE